MSARTRQRVVACLGLVTLSGCFGTGTDSETSLPPERRAALARVVVENRTDVRLSIGFRYAEPGNEVGIGDVSAGARAEMAPVPALEPLVFIARGPGFQRQLAPRSLEIDQLWTWIIRPEGGEPR